VLSEVLVTGRTSSLDHNGIAVNRCGISPAFDQELLQLEIQVVESIENFMEKNYCIINTVQCFTGILNKRFSAIINKAKNYNPIFFLKAIFVY